MSKVVSLSGEEVIPPGKPIESVVALAEEMLEKARAGEVQGLFLAANHGDGTYSHRMAGKANGGTVGYIERLKYCVCRELEG